MLPRVTFALSGCTACLLIALTVVGSNSQHVGDVSTIGLADHPVIDVFFLQSQGVWILESDRRHEFLFRSFDEGRNWSDIPLQFPLHELFFLDSQHGWATETRDDHDSVLATSDGGLNWNVICPRLPSETLMVVGMFFTDLAHGWVLATQPKGLSIVLQTSDGGRTFSVAKALSGKFGLSHVLVSAPDSANLWMLGEDSVLYSPDGGQGWVSQVKSANLPGRRKSISFFGGHAFADGRVLLVGQSAGAVILKSTNLGSDWHLVTESNAAHWFNDIQFWDDNHGCAVGGSTLLFCTADRGDTWEARNVLPRSQTATPSVENTFEKLFLAKGGTRGWVLAGDGFLFETEDGGNSWRRLDLIETSNGR